MDSIWQQILNYQSYDIISTSYSNRHKKKISAKKINEIASNFIQAREYFLNTQKSSFSVKPLLLYYGVVGLARGIILILSANLTEAAMKQGHGLSTVRWKEVLSTGLVGIKDLKIAISSGTFLELLNATENKSYLKHNSSAVNTMVSYGIPDTGMELSFEELVKLIPDLIDEYQEWSGRPSLLHPLKQLTNIGDNQVKIIIEKTSYYSEDNLHKLFPDAQIEDSSREVHIITSKTKVPHLCQKFRSSFDIGQVYIGENPTVSFSLSTITTFYCLAYYLGMLARYFPSIWVSLDRISKGDRVYPLIQKLLDLIFQEFPKLTVDFLKGPYDFENKVLE